MKVINPDLNPKMTGHSIVNFWKETSTVLLCDSANFLLCKHTVAAFLTD